jgi:hypothetical protein
VISGKREIRKPKIFLEQDKAEADAKLHNQQQDNLTLLSQIAAASSNGLVDESDRAQHVSSRPDSLQNISIFF